MGRTKKAAKPGVKAPAKESAKKPAADASAAKKGLLDDSDSGDSDGELRVNEGYAKRFQHNKEREELHRLQAKHPHLAAKLALQAERKAQGLPSESEGDDEDDSDSESSSDDEPEEAVDEHFLKTLLSIRKRDPAIYQKDVKLFPEDDGDGEAEGDEDEEPKDKKKKEKKKKLTLRDVQARQLLEDGAEAAGASSESDGEGREKARGLTYKEEQEAIKREFLNAFKSADAGSDTDEDEDGGALLRKKEKTPAQLRAEQKEADEQAARTQKLLEEVFAAKRAKKGGAKEGGGGGGDEGEEFLKQYISNRMWLGDEGGSDDDDDGAAGGAGGARAADGSEDEEEVDRQEEFETNYNFRFEEPGGVALRSYSRHQEQSIRKGSEGRKQKRKEVAERKAAEKAKLQEEIKRLKNLKKKEIEDKLRQIRSVAGDDTLMLGADELDEDFDESKYDERMKKAFGEEYYEAEEEDEAAVKKPEFGDLEEELQEMLRGEAKHPQKKPGGDDDEEEDDDDDAEASGSDGSDGSDDDDGAEGASGGGAGAEGEGNRFSKKAMKKWRRALQKKMDEYYKLDAEDFVAGLPCRFKYKGVKPDLYGLKPEEILLLDDKELNQVVSIKKMAPYREEEERPQYGGKRERALAALRRVYRERLEKEMGPRKRSRADAEADDEAAARAASFVAPTKKARRAAMEAAKQQAEPARPDGKKLSKSALKRIRRRAAAREAGGKIRVELEKA